MFLEDIQQKRLSQEDTYQSLLLTTQAKMSWFLPNDAEYAHMDWKLDAITQAHTFAQGRLMQHEMQIREQLRNLELDFLPIRFVSNQSNVKGQIIEKTELLSQDDTCVMLQNITCPSESEVLGHIS